MVMLSRKLDYFWMYLFTAREDQKRNNLYCCYFDVSNLTDKNIQNLSIISRMFKSDVKKIFLHTHMQLSMYNPI